jgi:cytochrome bd-type quinol oxidase subunit 1
MTDLHTLAATVTGLTALVGLFVAYQAYRGYRRNDSETMRALSVGILLVAVVPFLISYGVGPATGVDDATVLFAILLSHTLGLAAVYRSLA